MKKFLAGLWRCIFPAIGFGQIALENDEFLSWLDTGMWIIDKSVPIRNSL